MECRAVDLKRAVRAFGSYSELARRLDISLSTCHGWKRRKKIPPWRAEKIARLAEAEGLDVFKRQRNRRGATRRKAAQCRG